ncbi:hypothetical protein K440DRAFT_629384 [Wilcoxina mikolae CBS 423.85]|nr:hypothetical protein K440DRAFT_629384 [Wilcoxina mikolae CBS 423.85]
MHNNHVIFRLKSRRKPPLNATQEADRVRLAHEGIFVPDNAISFSDEIWMELNFMCHKKNQS